MSDDLRPWLEEGAPEGLGELLESAVVDEPTAQQLIALQGALAPLFWTPPSGGGGGGADGGAGAGGGGAPPAPPAGPAAGGASAAGGAATTAGLATGTKIALVATMSTLVAGAVTFQAGRAYERQSAPRVVAPAPAPAPVATAPTPAPPPEPEVAQPPEPVAPPKPVIRPQPKPVAAAPEPAPAKADELDALQDAMESVRSGNAADALAKLERHAKDFPDSALAQERDVLIIESLVNLGRKADAQARADAFRKKWPTSTHLVRIETLLRKE